MALTWAEVAECRASVAWFDFEAAGGVGLELIVFLYAILVMHVLVEEWYVPALELVTSPEVLNVPRPLLGCTIMAGANCLPELSMSLIALLLTGSQDVGTGEVFGSCVFDLLGILGVVSLYAPPSSDGGIRLAPPLMVFFVTFTAMASAADASLFFADVETMWPASMSMLAMYAAFVVGAFVCWRVIPGFVGDDETTTAVAAPSPALTLRIADARHGTLPSSHVAAAPRQTPTERQVALLPSPRDDIRATSTGAYALAAAGAAHAPSTATSTLATSPTKSSLVPGGASGECGVVDGFKSSSAACGAPTPVSGEVRVSAQESTPLLKAPPPAPDIVIPLLPPASPPLQPQTLHSRDPHGAAGGQRRGCVDGLFEVLSLPPRILFRYTVPHAHTPVAAFGGLRPWALTLVLCITYVLLLSFSMVTIATRAICVLGVRKNALGATVLSLAAGFPDLITAAVLVRRPGMQTMAAANPFGAFAFNGLVALGLPWVILGSYADIFPPARGTWLPSLVGFCAIALALLAILLNGLRLTRTLGAGLLTLYVLYLTVVIYDGFTRPARPPA